MSLVGGTAFLALAISVLTFGWLADRWIASKGNPTRVLKTLCGGGLALASVSFVVVFLVADHTIAMAVLIFSCVALGMCSPNLWTMTQILAGPQTAGKWAGLENFCGNVAGIVAPIVVGVILERTGQFFWAFAITGAVTLLGAASYIFLVGSVEPVKWSRVEVLRHSFSVSLPQHRETCLTYVCGFSHLPDAADRNTASITAIFLIASSMRHGTSPSPRMARENTSP